MIERVADEVELAGRLEMLQRAGGLAAVREALRPQVPAGVTVCDCIGCGKPLPTVRVAYKWVRCAPCQGELEKRLKLQGRR
jgi:hypothetical protein